MPKKPIQHAKDQLDFAAQFAAPDLYRNRSWLNDEWLGSQSYKVAGQEKQHTVSCWSTRSSTKAEQLMGLDSFPLYNSPDAPDAPIFVQQVKVFADKIVKYAIRYDDGPRRQVPPTSQANLTRGLFKGYISTESGRVIRKRLEAWIKSVHINRDVNSKWSNPDHSHIVFATLTLPSQQQHGDNEIKRKCLMPFLQEIKRKHGVGEYFWSAEPQRNGNIHFHLLFDRYIAKDRLNDMWLTASDHLGYFSRYVSSTGETSAPATKINVCPPDMSLVKYIMKYVSKQPQIRCSYKEVQGKGEKRVSYWSREEFKGGQKELVELGYDLSSHDVDEVNGRWFGYFERRPIEGRSWGMSKGLLNLDVFTSTATYRVHDLLSIAEWAPEVKLLKVDHAEIYFMNTHDFMQKHDIVLLQEYRCYYLKLYQSIYHPPEDVPIIQFEPAQVSVPIIQSAAPCIQLKMAV